MEKATSVHDPKPKLRPDIFLTEQEKQHMGKKRGPKTKDPYAEVPQEFRDSMMKADDKVINEKIAEIAKNNAALQEAKDQDEDLKDKKRTANEAGAVYREGAKACKQKIKYLRDILAGRGKDAGDAGLPEPKDMAQAMFSSLWRKQQPSDHREASRP
jgi:hypothetical protein